MAKEYYAVIDVHKIKSLPGLSGQQRHNDRNYRMNHVDENQSYLNRDIISTGGTTYRNRWKDIITEREITQGFPIKVRSNSVIALDIVTAFSPGAEKELGIDIEKWCEANKAWMEKTFGADNIIAMTLHMDETDETPHARRGAHIHTQVVPIDERGHLCARSFTGGRTALKNLHSSYAKAMSEFGLSRGEPNSKIKHTERKRWYAKTAALCEAKAPRIKDGETFEQYMDRLDKVFQDINIAASKVVDNARRSVDHSQTRQAQIFGEYAYAVNLQHILEEGFDGDEAKVNERLKKYQTIEKCVPRKSLEAIVDNIIEKYPPEKSVNFWRQGKKKRHKKWEDLPVSGDDNTRDDDLLKLQEILNVEEVSEKESEKKEQFKEVSQVNDSSSTENGQLGNDFGETLG